MEKFYAVTLITLIVLTTSLNFVIADGSHRTVEGQLEPQTTPEPRPAGAPFVSSEFYQKLIECRKSLHSIEYDRNARNITVGENGSFVTGDFFGPGPVYFFSRSGVYQAICKRAGDKPVYYQFPDDLETTYKTVEGKLQHTTNNDLKNPFEVCSFRLVSANRAKDLAVQEANRISSDANFMDPLKHMDWLFNDVYSSDLTTAISLIQKWDSFRPVLEKCTSAFKSNGTTNGIVGVLQSLDQKYRNFVASDTFASVRGARRGSRRIGRDIVNLIDRMERFYMRGGVSSVWDGIPGVQR